MNQMSASIGGIMADPGIEVSEFDVQMKDRWAVWQKDGNRPHHFHKTRNRALAEATRLAGLNPGKKFHVVHFDVKVSTRGVAA